MFTHYTGIVSYYWQILFGGAISATQKGLAYLMDAYVGFYTYIDLNYLSEIYPVSFYLRLLIITCTHTHIHTPHTYTQTHIHTYKHMHTHKCTHMHTYTYIYTHAYTYT